MAQASELIVQIATAAGATGVIGTALTSWVTRRKSRADVDAARADAAQVLSQAAASLVGPLESRVHALATQLEENERRLNRHASWDREVADRLRDLGQKVGDPPPLWWNDDDNPHVDPRR